MTKLAAVTGQSSSASVPAKAAFRGAPPVWRPQRLVPQKLLFSVGYRYYRSKLGRFVRKRLPGRYHANEPGALPPPELISTEALMREQDLAVRSQAEWYFGSGCRDALRVLQDLANSGFDLRSMKTVLEFGCGSSRVLRWLRNIAGLELHGSDANRKPVAWGQANLPGIHFHDNELQPPLVLPDESCDCVYALSVFTHIPLEWQAAWLQELRRILRLGGYLVCTVAGAPYVHEQLDEQERHFFDSEGKLTLTADNPHASYSTQMLGSWDVFQSRDEVERCFSEGFQILTYTDQRVGQDRLVLKKH